MSDMTTIYRLDDPLRFHQAALRLRAQRQEILAANIANGDTPHFKARDLDFKAALQGALGGRGGSLALARTAPRHLPASTGASFPGPLLYRGETQSSVDGNTVDLDVERAQFAENAIQYEASLTFINGLLRTMQTAIQGQ
jgi:flagellar basal-body rod protein FlgB